MAVNNFSVNSRQIAADSLNYMPERATDEPDMDYLYAVKINNKAAFD